MNQRSQSIYYLFITNLSLLFLLYYSRLDFQGTYILSYEHSSCSMLEYVSSRAMLHAAGHILWVLLHKIAPTANEKFNWLLDSKTGNKWYAPLIANSSTAIRSFRRDLLHPNYVAHFCCLLNRFEVPFGEVREFGLMYRGLCTMADEIKIGK